MIAYIVTIYHINMIEMSCVKYFFDVIHLSERSIMMWLLAILLIYKPADILIQKILKSYKPSSELRASTVIVKDNNTGRVIGMIASTIIVVLSWFIIA